MRTNTVQGLIVYFILLHTTDFVTQCISVVATPLSYEHPGCVSSSSAAQDFDKGPPELDVEGGVDNRVESAVDITQPGESAVERGRHVARPAVGVQNVSHKERQPADEEHPWSGRERLDKTRMEQDKKGTQAKA